MDFARAPSEGFDLVAKPFDVIERSGLLTLALRWFARPHALLRLADLLAQLIQTLSDALFRSIGVGIDSAAEANQQFAVPGSSDQSGPYRPAHRATSKLLAVAKAPAHGPHSANSFPVEKDRRTVAAGPPPVCCAAAASLYSPLGSTPPHGRPARECDRPGHVVPCSGRSLSGTGNPASP